MKTIFAFLLICSRLCAGNITFTIEDDLNVVGTVTYSLYARDATGHEVKVVSGVVGKSVSLDVQGGSWTYWATAVSTEGFESTPSEVTPLTVPFAPKKVVPQKQVALLESRDMQTWKTVATYDVPDLDRAFYRIEFVQ